MLKQPLGAGSGAEGLVLGAGAMGHDIGLDILVTEMYFFNVSALKLHHFIMGREWMDLHF